MIAVARHLVGPESHSGGQQALAFIKFGLAKRGLLEQKERTALQTLAQTEFVVPEQTSRLIDERPAEPVKRLFQECETQRPDVWKRITYIALALIRDQTDDTP